jgi:glycyl-tRNA synthetase beta chain
MEDGVPRTLEGALLAIADKADSIVGMFGLGLAPTGSKDPFALRRQANGIVKIMAEHRLPFTLSAVRDAAGAAYTGTEAARKFTTAAGQADVSAFFRERLEFYLRDVLGYAYDVVNAVLAVGADDVVDAMARAEAVAKARTSEDFAAISSSFKRMKNILRQAAEAGKWNPAAGNLGFENAKALANEDPAELQLASQSATVASSVRKLRAARQYEPALTEVSRLRPAVDAFFDKVMVMVDEEETRTRRLALLQTLLDEFSTIADFSEIITAK